MGNCHALFGKGPTEKDSDERTSPVAYFTLEGPGVQLPRPTRPRLPGETGHYLNRQIAPNAAGRILPLLRDGQDQLKNLAQKFAPSPGRSPRPASQ